MRRLTHDDCVRGLTAVSRIKARAMDALATRCSRCGMTMSEGLDERGEVVRYCPACANAHAQPLCPCCRRPLDRLDGWGWQRQKFQ
jgi:hypothetical protein